MVKIAVATLAVVGSIVAAIIFDNRTAVIVIPPAVSIIGLAIGYVLGHKDGPTQESVRSLMLRISSELVQYRTFTRLLRDQGVRITESTSKAAAIIVSGLTEMDANIHRMKTLIDCTDPSKDLNELRSLTDVLSTPMVRILEQLQFQDITQQQIVFLSRLSLLVEQHMLDLANHLDNQQAMDRIVTFKEIFERAHDDCVMDSQRDDHHAAVDINVSAKDGVKIEMFNN